MFSPFLFHFYIFCLNQPGIREKNGTGMGFELQDVTQFMDSKVFESALGS